MTEYKLITERLIKCRKQMGITKIEAARRIGVSQPAYLRYESGDRTPSIQVIKEIAKVFQTSVDYLTGKSDSANPNMYIVTETDNPELFYIISKYYQYEKEQQKRLLAYLDSFQ